MQIYFCNINLFAMGFTITIKIGNQQYDFKCDERLRKHYGGGGEYYTTVYTDGVSEYDTIEKLRSSCQWSAQRMYDNERGGDKSRSELNQPESPKKKQQQRKQEKSSALAQCIYFIIFLATLFPMMLFVIIMASLFDSILFIISFGLCFGKCKQPKRTWCSYACTRRATECSKEMTIKVCDWFLSCHCCCLMAPFTLPIGSVLVILSAVFDVVAWLVTGFYCFGYCCSNQKVFDNSIAKIAWTNLRRCAWRTKNCY